MEQPEINIQASHAWLKKSNIHPETEGFIFAIQDRVINTRNYQKHICGLQSIIDKCFGSKRIHITNVMIYIRSNYTHEFSS
jgi:hypothetical protein